MENLNEEIVLNFYLEQIEKDSIEFLMNRNKYKQAIKSLVLELRDEDNMHNKIEISKKLWKILFEAAMSYIDPDKRGYDDLFKFFDKYVNFEELIFASDSFYRDHTLHCLWVYFLGEYIARHNEFNFILENMYKENNRLIKFLNYLEEGNEYDIFTEMISLMKQVLNIKADDSIRCISALTHDLGYPIKKISKINTCIKEILPHFSINNYQF